MPTRSKPPAVDAYLAELDHPLIADIQALRRLILGIDPSIGEAIKWNAPSFHTSDHFATMRLHGKPGLLQLILHLGTKKQQMPTDAIDDPDALLKWLGPDRACVDLSTPGSVAVRRKALEAILRQWLAHVPD